MILNVLDISDNFKLFFSLILFLILRFSFRILISLYMRILHRHIRILENIDSILFGLKYFFLIALFVKMCLV